MRINNLSVDQDDRCQRSFPLGANVSDLRSVMTYMRPARPTCSASSRRRESWGSNMGCAIQRRLGAAMASLEQPRQVPDIPERPPLPEPEPDIPDEPGAHLAESDGLTARDNSGGYHPDPAFAYVVVC